MGGGEPGQSPPRIYKWLSCTLVCFCLWIHKKMWNGQKKGDDGVRVLFVYGGQKTLKRIDFQDFRRKKRKQTKKWIKVETGRFSHVASYIRTHRRVTTRSSSKQFTIPAVLYIRDDARCCCCSGGGSARKKSMHKATKILFFFFCCRVELFVWLENAQWCYRLYEFDSLGRRKVERRKRTYTEWVCESESHSS